MKNESLARAAAGARILEAVDNYARADMMVAAPIATSRDEEYFYDERSFWRLVLRNRMPLGTPVRMHDVAISEWVARVPGLFWTDDALMHRDHGFRHVERRDRSSITLRPLGKSEMVSGGVGTLKLAPSVDGYRLCSLVMNGNVSSGVPALIAPEVWEQHRLREGTVVSVKQATWQGMATSWAQQFRSTRGIPRAYIQINDPGAVEVIRRGFATEIHPFSVMEYNKGSIKLFDFVFATVFTSEPHLRRLIAEFFDSYKVAEGREGGRYLIDADIAEPMWESEYGSPEALRVGKDLLERRIEDAMIGKNTTEYLLEVLCSMNIDLLRRVSAVVGVPHSRWHRGGSLADESANFLTQVPTKDVPALIDAIRVLNPDLLEVSA